MFYDRLKNISSLNFSSFKDFSGTFLESLYVKILIQGNVSEQNAMRMAQKITDKFNLTEKIKMTKEITGDVLQIPVGTSSIEIKSLHSDYNSVIKNYYQIGKASIRIESLAELIVSLINEPLFDALRSQAQLGYGIACSMRKNLGVVGILITVDYQENKNSAHVIDSKIGDFLKAFTAMLNEMTDEDLLAAKRSLMSLKLNADAELEKEVDRNWEEIKRGENVFNRNELESVEIENTCKTEIVEFYEQIFLSDETTRKLSVRVIGEGISTTACVDDFQIKEVVGLREKLVPMI